MFGAKTTKSRNKIQRKIFLLLVLLIVLFVFIVARNFDLVTNQNSVVSPLAKTTSPNIKLEKLLLSENIPFSKIKVASDSSFIVFLQGGGEVNISQKKDLVAQISSLQLILSRLTIEGKKFKFLDLRFDKPVIVF
jgi:hypothetical protein